jgi:hypothetical protein
MFYDQPFITVVRLGSIKRRKFLPTADPQQK